MKTLYHLVSEGKSYGTIWMTDVEAAYARHAIVELVGEEIQYIPDDEFEECL